jgi:hypothetical protein
LRGVTEKLSELHHAPFSDQKGGEMALPRALARSHTAATEPLTPPQRLSDGSPEHRVVHAESGRATRPTCMMLVPQKHEVPFTAAKKIFSVWRGPPECG